MYTHLGLRSPSPHDMLEDQEDTRSNDPIWGATIIVIIYTYFIINVQWICRRVRLDYNDHSYVRETSLDSSLYAAEMRTVHHHYFIIIIAPIHPSSSIISFSPPPPPSSAAAHSTNANPTV